MNSATSASRRTPSTVTIESIPPPNGTSARRSAGAAGGVDSWPGALRASNRSEVRSRALR